MGVISGSSHKRVLVVDDEPTLRELIADALRDSGFEAQTATDGADALEVLHHWIPDVIVLDLMMPRLDGTGFTELMRLNPRFASLPVVLVTAAYGARVAAERVGARAVLTKPFELEQLVETVIQLAGASTPLPPTFQAAHAHRRADSAPPPLSH